LKLFKDYFKVTSKSTSKLLQVVVEEAPFLKRKLRIETFMLFIISYSMTTFMN